MEFKVTCDLQGYEHALAFMAQMEWDGKKQLTITDAKKVSRSDKQNKLSFKWYGEIHANTGNGVAFERARCKLMYGVPVLRAEDEKFRSVYDSYLKGYTYEQKIEIIETLEIPVTSLMTVKQMSVYLNTVDLETASKLGVVLSHPEDLYYDSLGIKRKEGEL